jgi:Putative auto-transporter adhesin, head GIN domain
MNKLVGTALVATTLSLVTQPASAEVRESRAIDARVTRITLRGAVSLVVHQGAIPSLIISGNKDGVARVITEQHGDTLEISSEKRTGIRLGWHKEKINAELTVPTLQEFVSQGVGSTTISGFSGEKINITQGGAGSLTMNARYRAVDASLGGAGSFKLDANGAERIDLRLGGAGHITMTGQAKSLYARLSGVGSLEAENLRADTVDLSMSGIGSATVFARSNASLVLSGMGSATVYGNPVNRSASTSGMGKVHWK